MLLEPVGIDTKNYLPRKLVGRANAVVYAQHMNVAWYAEIKWDFLRTRKQQVIRYRPDDVDVLFMEPYARGRANDYSLRDENGVRVATVPFLKNVPVGSVARPLVGMPWVRGLIDANAGRKVRDLFNRLGWVPHETVVVSSNAFASRVVKDVGYRAWLYDYNDAHASFPDMPPWTRNGVELALREASGVAASARALVDDVIAVRGSDSGVRMVGNGVDVALFANAAKGRAPERPRIGYVGAIAPWLDADLIANIARARPDWDIELVGPIMLGAEATFQPVLAMANVNHTPPIPHEKVPEVMAGFDVGLIPFRYNDLTRGVNPNKMYEYLAAGTPVVATRFSPEVEGHGELVAAVDPGDSFVEAIARFAERTRVDVERQALDNAARAFAVRHDWSQIAAEFWNFVRSLQE